MFVELHIDQTLVRSMIMFIKPGAQLKKTTQLNSTATELNCWIELSFPL